MSESPAETLLGIHLREVFPTARIEREFRFAAPKRRWRFDWALPLLMLACEAEGAVYSGGRHTRGKGFTEDCHKYSTATAQGWNIFRFTTAMIERGEDLWYLREWRARREK